MTSGHLRRGLNLKRGLWRLVLVLSALYVLAATAYVFSSAPRVSGIKILPTLGLIGGGPILMILLFALGLWIWRGFD